MGILQSTNNFIEPENVVLNNRNINKFPFIPSKDSPAKYLYLSGNKFRSLPKEMKNVAMVDLSLNNIGPKVPTELSEALSSYPNLKQLYFTNNRIKDLNDFKNDSLLLIYLTQNRFKKLPEDFFINFPQLQALYFDCNFLRTFSNQKSEFLGLLSLSLNNIETLETTTINFPHLTSLDLSKNRIKNLPNNLSKSFPNLRYLYLNDNFISEIPDDEDDENPVFPRSLSILNLSNNLIEKVPNSITNLPDLTDFDIENNRVTHIPKLNDSIVEFKAQSNKISSIENQELNFLKEFVIYNNELKKFPTEIKAVLSNSFLVDHNQITEIDFESIPINTVLSVQLTVIDVSFNQIEKIPKELFECLPNLQSFSAFFNKITEIPSEISKCQNLSYLNISYNPIKKLPKLPRTIDRLTACNCQIESFDDEPFAAPETEDDYRIPLHLRLVDLSCNKLESFPVISTIQILNLSQNRIRKMPQITDGMRILDLSMNLLESTNDSMPDFITGLSIVDLNLSSNKLTKMPKIQSAPLLQYFEISGNEIEGVFDITKFAFLERIDISQTMISITGKNEKLNEIIASPNNKPKCDMKNPIIINQEKNSGYSEFLGLRNSMEDSIIVRDDLNLYAICDGHGGPNTAKFASVKISELFESGIESFSFEKATDFVSEKFQMAEEIIHEMGLEDGSTLCLSFVCQNKENGKRKIVTAHLGDARAMIVRTDGKSRELTIDHKPSMRSEFERVHNEFGRVTRDNRIDGVLAVARSIGDLTIQGVGRVPEIKEFDIDQNDKFLVICCDGVFDVLSNDDVAKVAFNASSALEAAYTIRNAAFGAISYDNISAIVVDLTK